MIKFFRKIHVKIILVLTIILISSCETKTTINCEIKTNEGSIFVELYPNKAPITVANFLHYIDTNLYNDGSFFRVCNPKNEVYSDIKIEVIQGGTNESSDFPPINLETTQLTGIKHRNGILSMARGKPNTATGSFFICIGDQPALNFGGKRNPDGQGFAAFGKVIKGMDVVLAIQKMKDTSQYLINPVKIKNIKRIK